MHPTLKVALSFPTPLTALLTEVEAAVGLAAFLVLHLGPTEPQRQPGVVVVSPTAEIGPALAFPLERFQGE